MHPHELILDPFYPDFSECSTAADLLALYEEAEKEWMLNISEFVVADLYVRSFGFSEPPPVSLLDYFDRYQQPMRDFIRSEPLLVKAGLVGMDGFLSGLVILWQRVSQALFDLPLNDLFAFRSWLIAQCALGSGKIELEVRLNRCYGTEAEEFLDGPERAIEEFQVLLDGLDTDRLSAITATDELEETEDLEREIKDASIRHLRWVISFAWQVARRFGLLSGDPSRYCDPTDHVDSGASARHALDALLIAVESRLAIQTDDDIHGQSADKNKKNGRQSADNHAVNIPDPDAAELWKAIQRERSKLTSGELPWTQFAIDFVSKTSKTNDPRKEASRLLKALQRAGVTQTNLRQGSV